MTAHLHSTYVDGCYRCELNKDEAVCPNHGTSESCVLCSPCGGGQDTCDETLRYVCTLHSSGVPS